MNKVSKATRRMEATRDKPAIPAGLDLGDRGLGRRRPRFR
jgi:hypothetical protein